MCLEGPHAKVCMWRAEHNFVGQFSHFTFVYGFQIERCHFYVVSHFTGLLEILMSKFVFILIHYIFYTCSYLYVWEFGAFYFVYLVYNNIFVITT